MLIDNFTWRNALIRNIALGVGVLAWVGIGVTALLQSGGGQPAAHVDPVGPIPTEHYDASSELRVAQPQPSDEAPAQR